MRGAGLPGRGPRGVGRPVVGKVPDHLYHAMGQQACTDMCKAQEKAQAGRSSASCVCGNHFMDDAIYCRKCGAKRPDSQMPPEVSLVAWFRRRSGPDADFAEIFTELFGGREAVGARRWEEVMRERGCNFDLKGAFAYLDRHAKTGRVGAADLEMLQMEVEDREIDALKQLREFLKQNFKSPAAAFREMGKGEGDVLTRAEFVSALSSLGFSAEDPYQLFNMVDKDYSGEVCFNEFKSVLKNAGKSRARLDTNGGGKPKSKR